MKTLESRVLSLLLVAAAATACHDGPAAPSGPPDPVLLEAMRADVQVMIGDAMAGWWRASHHGRPGAALSTAADAHTSSWRNWGMLAASAEPRQTDLEAVDDLYGLMSTPWTELNRTLVSARDALLAIEAGVELGDDGEETHRAVVFATFMQGLALGTLAQIFSQAFIVDQTVQPADAELSPYGEVMDAALAKLDEALDLAAQESFTLPAPWVAFDRELDQDAFVRLARSFRARFAISAARGPAERQAVDWEQVLADVRGGLQQDWGGRYDGNHESNWAWSMMKLYAGVHPLWARLDYRTIGPADASGAYQVWLATPPPDRRPFHINTDDRRITGGGPTHDGAYVGFAGAPIFRPERGHDHFSFYTDLRWAHLLEARGVGLHPDFPVVELDFIEAEALYRLGDRAGAMAIVNRTRTTGGLPAFTDPGGVAPGGARCVPKRADGTCGDLWDALAYEKRIEVFHYGGFTEFLDDRAWGDLVPGTFLDFPPVTAGFGPVLQEVYGLSAQEAVELADDVTADGIRMKRLAYEGFDGARNRNPGDVAGS